MHSYRITLKLHSALGTPLAADTVWGHVAWGIRYREGEAALEQWLARYDQNTEPPLIISDPLPAGFWPRPALPSAPRKAPSDIEQAIRSKTAAKVSWISHDAWQRLAAPDLDNATVEAAVAEDGRPPSAVATGVVHIGVNRLSGGTLQPDGGALFTNEQTYYDDGGRDANGQRRPVAFDVWALSPESADQVKQWFVDGLAGGYGRDAATGLGDLEVADIRSEPLPICDGANAAILLGPAVPRHDDPATGFFSFGVRCGRLGGDFALAPGMQRQKRPVRCLERGSVLITDEPAPWIGRLVAGVHPDERIRHCGLAPLLPCRLSRDTLDHPLLRRDVETAAS